MIINDLLLKSFRDFKNINITLGNKTTLLIGKNGTGKTSLLTGLMYSLNLLFTKGISNCPKEAKLPILHKESKFPIFINTTATINGNTINWSLVKNNDKGRLLKTFYKEAIDIAKSLYTTNYDNIPILSFYGSSYIEMDDNVSNLDDDILKFTTDIVSRFSENMDLTNELIIPFDNLSRSYKRIFSIVFNIAYKSYILNGNQEPTGIVIIDDIDMYLHPNMQCVIIDKLEKSFPLIQFIISTHSALIVSNFRADGIQNKTIKLISKNGIISSINVENVYGIDYTTTLMEVMGSGYRASTVDKLINVCLGLYGKKEYDKADKIYSMLKEYLGGKIPEKLDHEINMAKL